MTNHNYNSKKIPTYLILGYPRSGTTWFANLFNTHPDVVYRHEIIGRCHREFPAELFKKLKFNYSLDENEYKKALSIILAPNIESDRAPFFKKNHLLVNHPEIHYVSWLACKAAPFLKPLYRYLFLPRGEGLKLFIKETRSAMNMDSIIEGLRTDRNIILFRHPCGAIASSLKGIETGKMQAGSNTARENWLDENKDRMYIKSLNLTPSNILSLPEHEYLALRWRLQNEDYLNFSSKNDNNIYISYEDFMIDQEKKVKTLFAKLPLSYDPGVESFILASSGDKSEKPLLKDSSSNFYSVYRNKGFDPDKWKTALTPDQISSIEKHTLDIFDKLLESSRN